MRKKINTERIERLIQDTKVLSKVVDQLLQELNKAPALTSPLPQNRLARFFEADEDDGLADDGL
jgi:hypothetical protein